MAEKYAVGAQAAGFISFREAVKDISDPGVTQRVSISDGMLCIGDNGKGYVIQAAEYMVTKPSYQKVRASDTRVR